MIFIAGAQARGEVSEAYLRLLICIIAPDV